MQANPKRQAGFRAISGYPCPGWTQMNMADVCRFISSAARFHAAPVAAHAASLTKPGTDAMDRASVVRIVKIRTHMVESFTADRARDCRARATPLARSVQGPAKGLANWALIENRGTNRGTKQHGLG